MRASAMNVSPIPSEVHKLARRTAGESGLVLSCHFYFPLRCEYLAHKNRYVQLGEQGRDGGREGGDCHLSEYPTTIACKIVAIGDVAKTDSDCSDIKHRR